MAPCYYLEPFMASLHNYAVSWNLRSRQLQLRCSHAAAVKVKYLDMAETLRGEGSV
jgi:hypothetical protein